MEKNREICSIQIKRDYKIFGKVINTKLINYSLYIVIDGIYLINKNVDWKYLWNLYDVVDEGTSYDMYGNRSSVSKQKYEKQLTTIWNILASHHISGSNNIIKSPILDGRNLRYSYKNLIFLINTYGIEF